jgi:putative membrane protein
MKRKQFLALMIAVSLAAGTNMTAVNALAADTTVTADQSAEDTEEDKSEENKSEDESKEAGSEEAGTEADRSEEDKSGTDASDESGSDEDRKSLENAMTQAAGQVSTGAAKEETVYVFTDEYGEQRDITVSNWLKNPDKKDKLEDESVLQDIENVKGDETFDKDGDMIT